MAEQPTPAIALRRAASRGGELDDVVVKGVDMFRAEILDAGTLWLCCYLTNGERIAWHVCANEGIEFDVVEMPESYEDFDRDAGA